MHKILVTGASGYIGGAVVEHLRTVKGNKVVALGRERLMRFEAYGNVEYHVVDLAHLVHPEHFFQTVDTVIHCGGLAGDWGAYDLYHQANVVTTENVIRWCHEFSVKRLIFFSSPSIGFDYKDCEDVLDTHVAKPLRSAFAQTKLLAERAVIAAHSDNLQTIALRPRVVISANDRHVLPGLIRLHRAHSLKRIGDGNNRVSTTHIDNVLHAVDCVLSAQPHAWGEVYNIADDQPVKIWHALDGLFARLDMPPLKQSIMPYSVLMIVAWMAEMLAKWIRWGYRPRLTRMRVTMLSLNFTVSIDKAKRLLGYQPVKTAYDAVEEFARQWKDRQEKYADDNLSNSLRSW